MRVEEDSAGQGTDALFRFSSISLVNHALASFSQSGCHYDCLTRTTGLAGRMPVGLTHYYCRRRWTSFHSSLGLKQSTDVSR